MGGVTTSSHPVCDVATSSCLGLCVTTSACPANGDRELNACWTTSIVCAHCAHDKPLTVHCVVHCLGRCSWALYENTIHGNY